MTKRHEPVRNSEAILTQAPPPPDARLAYGADPNHFGELRLPAIKAHGQRKHAVLMFIHGGFWRAKYGLTHAGHLCSALATHGIATWNTEYRRVGNEGGGWPGTFEDLQNSLRFLHQLAPQHGLDPARLIVAGHSAGGELALALAARQAKLVHAAVSLAGVLDLGRAYELHLSNDAVLEFMGGTPRQMHDHYSEADPMLLHISVPQLIVHGAQDDTVPVAISQDYVRKKHQEAENVRLLELPGADHFDVLDPVNSACISVQKAIGQLL